MVMTARSKHILVQDDGKRLLAVYPLGVEPNDLASMVKRLAIEPGIRAGTERMASSNSPLAHSNTVVWMRLLPSCNVQSALRLFKALTRPMLPHALARLTLELLVCECRYLKSSGDMQFVTGLEPDDLESFELRYYAMLQKLDMVGLVNAGPNPPYMPLRAALEELLSELGAYASEIHIWPKPDSRPCTHRTIPG